jgi:hypothetical protein
MRKRGKQKKLFEIGGLRPATILGWGLILVAGIFVGRRMCAAYQVVTPSGLSGVIQQSKKKQQHDQAAMGGHRSNPNEEQQQM